MLAHLSKLKSGEMYGGTYKFKGDEYKSMVGPDNTTAPFFSGHAYWLSSRLASVIFSADRLHTFLFDSYGTSSEDANVGKWVQYAARRHNLNVTWESKPDFMNDLANKPEATQVV
eukprot:TRINITY_DN4038_c0_g3_i1.p1 TRINITY_DN4038_c0_g3~~TRINITY_DN4038_c0_g3_i1.p1  ORF type:complete len:115 (-),score=8.49 TRINITY_DN4038_c0_g3_i1:419-763(-)